MAYEAEQAAAAAAGYAWDPTDPHNWRMIAGQQQAAAKGWTWSASDPANWTHIAAEQAAGGVGAPAATPGADTSGQAAAATFGTLSAYLADAGLSELFTVTNGVPSGWLWDQITSGVDSAAALQMSLEQTDTFKARYGVIGEMRKRAAAGEPVHIPTMSQVREYESTVSSIMRQAGVPAWAYDTFQEVQDLMAKGISAVEVEERVASTWSRLNDAPAEVRQAFTQMYGVDGDAALVSYMLDPQQTQAKLDKVTRAAYTKGWGQKMGVDMDKLLAERIAEAPNTEAGIYSDLQRISAISGLFEEALGETTDLTATTGIEAEMLGDSQAATAMQRRMIQRQSIASSTAGSAAITQGGVTGLS